VKNFRFAVISDPHVAIPQTIAANPYRFHRVEVSIPALEWVLEQLKEFQPDFLLMPGDLTQDGEPENHEWLQEQLKSLPFPVYVVPGNHDVVYTSLEDFPYYYQNFGYCYPQQPYYSLDVLDGVQIIGLNSNQFATNGKQLGCLDLAQLAWLENLLPTLEGKLILVMIHHNVIEHLPNQANHELGRRYMLDNAQDLLGLLARYGVSLIFTGHLHVQDIVSQAGIYEITTGSLVSYPHPYRLIEVREGVLEITSPRVTSLRDWENLSQLSKQWLCDRSGPFMLRLLTGYPLHLETLTAESLAPQMRDFWANIAEGDSIFDFPEFPARVRDYLRSFGAIDAHGNPRLIDNQYCLRLG
jgi:3',5'-cyclic AMP phosphodiesterase CpdA